MIANCRFSGFGSWRRFGAELRVVVILAAERADADFHRRHDPTDGRVHAGYGRSNFAGFRIAGDDGKRGDQRFAVGGRRASFIGPDRRGKRRYQKCNPPPRR
jgi:hypothetical protein